MKKPIPTKLVVAPRGHSWHGDKLQKDTEGTVTPTSAKRTTRIFEQAVEKAMSNYKTFR